MSYKNYIRKFDFATAKFEELPKEVFRLDRKTLSPMERAILDGIKFQMAVSKGNEIVQKINYANAVRSVTTGITFRPFQLGFNNSDRGFCSGYGNRKIGNLTKWRKM
ncbi:MAG: hypothetical protein UT06_C0056G0002 [Candidatus Woesebacteria bacterium GW2011_GWA1_38_8]|uniref:Uncharacterized protein n=1 Tax=Candidatus Woesebacteria bacterium GW2011_GWA1_38_8 TaxID=1618547 RepID=A0A0G0KSH3_9BACT|nr:MAG: hypothetical protein UT06_C0056G0002 [Candidatus Woesebacteria bacterium GW2011_GWA1_38_8]